MHHLPSYHLPSVTRLVALALALALALAVAACAPPAAAPSGAPAPAPTRAGATSAPTAAPSAAGAASAAPTPARPPEKIRLAYTSLTGVAAVPVIAQERGLFAANNLDAEVLYIASAATAMQSLLSGEIQFIMGGTEAVLSAAAAGADLRIVGGIVDVVPFSVVVRPEITTPEGLRGQRLGITRIGSATDYALRAAVRRHGLDPDRDITIVQLGGVPEILAGMEGGAAAGGTLSLPVLAQARRAGYRELIDLPALGIPYQTNSLTTTAGFDRDRPGTVTATLRALAQAIHVLKTDRPTAIATYAALLKDDDPAVLDETYERYAKDYVQRVPLPNRAAILAIQEQLLVRDERVRDLKLDDLIDERPVRALEAEGLFTRLYPGS